MWLWGLGIMPLLTRLGGLNVPISVKHVLLYAVVPAVVVGVFSLAPKLYETVTSSRDLTYSVTSGPGIPSQDAYRRVVAVEVSNSGRARLTDIAVTLRVSGSIESYAVGDAPGIAPQVVARPGDLLITVPVLHSGEQFSVSALLLISDGNVVPSVSVRSNEVLGSTLENAADSSQELRLALLGALSAALAAFTMALVARGHFGDSKTDNLFYIAARLSLTHVAREASRPMTYLRMADTLLAHGLADEEIREKAATALRCLLLIGNMNSTSRAVVVSNLKTLEGEEYSQEDVDLLIGRALHVRRQGTLRSHVDSYIDNPAAFLTEP